MTPTPQLSVVIPCFNEQGNIEKLVTSLRLLSNEQGQVEFVLVDNGSTDNTGQLLRTLTQGVVGVRVVSLPTNFGYGHGIKAGLRDARGHYLGWTHSHNQTDPKDVYEALSIAASRNGPTIVKGRRYGRSRVDTLFTWGMSVFESLLFRMKLRDINAQPTIFSRGLLADVLAGPDDFSLDLYALVVARQREFVELRFPVKFGPRFSGESKWNTSTLARIKFVVRTVSFSLSLVKRKMPT